MSNIWLKITMGAGAIAGYAALLGKMPFVPMQDQALIAGIGATAAAIAALYHPTPGAPQPTAAGTVTKVSVLLLAVLCAGTLLSAATFPLKPDPKLTPGAIMSPQPSLKTLCTAGYSATVRNVPESEKAAVFKEYGIDRHATRFEVDHLISLELGGSNDIKNLWAQAYTTKPYNATVKDTLENRLHWLICNAKLPPAVAQKAIASDWTAAYQHYVVDKATAP